MRRISLIEFAEIIMNVAQTSDYTLVDSVGHSCRDDKSYHTIFLKDIYGRERRIDIPYYINEE